MTMTDDEKAARAERRAEERIEAALDRERDRQDTLATIAFGDEDHRKITYHNRQLLRRERSHEWPFLRSIRKDILRFYTSDHQEDE